MTTTLDFKTVTINEALRYGTLRPTFTVESSLGSEQHPNSYRIHPGASKVKNQHNLLVLLPGEV